MGNARALMFDFNGTLSQDEPLLLAIYQRLFARYGRPLSEEQYFSRLAGLSEEAIVGGWLGVDGPLLDSLVAERVEAYAAEAADGVTVTEPVREAVRYAAARVPVAVVSGAFRAEIEPVVEAAGIAAELTAIVSADDVEHGKPHPRATCSRSSGSASTPPRRSRSRTPRRASRPRRRLGCGVSPSAARCPTSGSPRPTSSSTGSTSTSCAASSGRPGP